MKNCKDKIYHFLKTFPELIFFFLIFLDLSGVYRFQLNQNNLWSICLIPLTIRAIHPATSRAHYSAQHASFSAFAISGASMFAATAYHAQHFVGGCGLIFDHRHQKATLAVSAPSPLCCTYGDIAKALLHFQICSVTVIFCCITGRWKTSKVEACACCQSFTCHLFLVLDKSQLI